MKISKDEEILNNIVSKAWRDPEFKAKLIKDPTQTIEDFLGRSIHFPEGKKISFVDQSDKTTIFINIPVEPNLEDIELNEEQLDVISGGNTGIVIIKPSNHSGEIFS